MRILLLALCVLLPSPVLAQTDDAASSPSRWLIGGMIAGNALDVVSTELLLSDFACRKCHEGNPLARPFAGHPASLIAYKAAGTAFQVWIVHKLHRSGHPTAAKFIGWLSLATPTIAGLSNLRQR